MTSSFHSPDGLRLKIAPAFDYLQRGGIILNERKLTLKKRWLRAKRFAYSFWLVRGVVAAITLIAIVGSIIDFSLYDIARAIHAIIVGWHNIAGWLGQWIGKIPFLPDLSPELVNGLMFVLAVIVPVAYSIYRRFTQRWKVRWTAFLFAVVYVIMFGGVVLLVANISPGLKDDPPQGMAAFALMYTAVSWGHTWVLALRHLPGYFQGLMITLGALLVFEILYFVPIVGEPIKQFADAVLGPR